MFCNNYRNISGKNIVGFWYDIQPLLNSPHPLPHPKPHHCTGYLAPLSQNNEHTLDNLHDKCLTIIPVFFAATAYRSWTLCGSLTHSSTSPAALSVQGSLECNNLFQTPPCYIDLSCGRIPELHVQMMLPFCRVKNFPSPPIWLQKIFTRNFFLWNIFNLNMLQLKDINP